VKVVVVGAGIAGLAAAWELLRSGRGIDLTVLESERRPGGVVITDIDRGFVAEGGPDAFLGSEPELPALAGELSIPDAIVTQQTRGTWQWTGERLEPIEEGKAAAALGIDVKGADVTRGFRSFARGMAQPVWLLAERLSGSIRYAQGVTGLTPDGHGWRVAIAGGAAYDADALVLALPAYAAGRLLENAGAAGARDLGEVTYFPSLTVSLGYRAADIRGPIEGTGFIATTVADDGMPVRACTYASLKFPGRAPDGHVLLRAFLTPHDEEATARAHRVLARVLDIAAAPVWSRAYRWVRGLPRYATGHQERVADVRRRLERLPPLAIAGAGYDGAGVSACVRSGREAARYLLNRAS